ncbi:MAG: hypothetical protein ACFB0B_15665 [Thermonemataceae bacterium]
MAEKLPQHDHQGKSDCQDKCKEFDLQKFYLVLDGEANSAQTQQLKAHIADCYPCYQHYDLAVAIRKILQYKITKKCMSIKDIEEIRARISQMV